MSDLAAHVLETIRREELAPSGTRILCALSGGPDSVVMLHLLRSLAPERGWDLAAGHVDHALRPDSGADADFCRDLCEDWGVPFRTERVRWDDPGGRPAANVEARARDARYGILGAWAAENGARLAVAHHADDRAETFLAQLIRGAGPHGLSLPHYRREDGVIRPLLDCSRSELRAYRDDHSLPFRADPTNTDGSSLRARLRAEVMPVLLRENPEAVRAIGRAGRTLARTADFLDGEADRAAASLGLPGPPGEFLLDGPRAQPYHPVVLSTLLWKAVRQLGGDAGFEPLDRCVSAWRAGDSFHVDLPGGVRISIDQTRVALFRTEALPALPERSVSIPGRVSWDGGERESGRGFLHLNVETAEPPKNPGADSGPYRVWIDADRVIGPLTVRSRRPGDRYRPLGMEGSVKIQDLFVDRKIPRRVRDTLPIVTDAEGILWVPGFRVDHRGRITESTVKA
ncbi:MAG: tRNA lysidine(34) synthetase TilS, partial [Gemmatimonadetes bacterium]|nr:tRNA lysidine(34) synthetase TilS [Gemmatimonadota bacterium]